MVVSLQASAATGSGTDSLTGLENILGSRFNDMLTGDAGPNLIADGYRGSSGVDTIPVSTATMTFELAVATTPWMGDSATTFSEVIRATTRWTAGTARTPWMAGSGRTYVRTARVTRTVSEASIVRWILSMS